MASGKVLCILGGIIVLVGTFLFPFFYIDPAYTYYIAFLMNIGTWFNTGEALITIMVIVFLVIMFSGVFILIGAKSRAMAIIGSLLAIIMAAYWILVIYLDLPFEIEIFSFMFLDTALVDGIIPVPLSIGAPGLATWLFLGGGVLGFIGGIMGPSDF
ncbi:MAG: hypothetical protein ACFE9S_03985 [Candidatus Hermodarchaeota archaeon]